MITSGLKVDTDQPLEVSSRVPQDREETDLGESQRYCSEKHSGGKDRLAKGVRGGLKI